MSVRGRLLGESEVLQYLRPGAVLRTFYQPGNLNNRTEHVRAVVDGDVLVIRFWSKHRKRWVYAVESPFLYQIKAKDGCLFLLKKP